MLNIKIMHIIITFISTSFVDIIFNNIYPSPPISIYFSASLSEVNFST